MSRLMIRVQWEMDEGYGSDFGDSEPSPLRIQNRSLSTELPNPE